jgi:hypothetical protein
MRRGSVPTCHAVAWSIEYMYELLIIAGESEQNPIILAL